MQQQKHSGTLLRCNMPYNFPVYTSNTATAGASFLMKQQAKNRLACMSLPECYSTTAKASCCVMAADTLTHCFPRRCWRVDSDLKVYLQPELAFCIWSNRYMTDLVTMPSSVSPIERTDLHCLVIAQRVHVGTIANLIGIQIYASVCMKH